MHIFVVVWLDSARPYDLDLRSCGLQIHVDMGSPPHVGVVQRDQLQTLGGHGPHVGDRLQKAAAEELIEAVGSFM